MVVCLFASDTSVLRGPLCYRVPLCALQYIRDTRSNVLHVHVVLYSVYPKSEFVALKNALSTKLWKIRSEFKEYVNRHIVETIFLKPTRELTVQKHLLKIKPSTSYVVNKAWQISYWKHSYSTISCPLSMLSIQRYCSHRSPHSSYDAEAVFYVSLESIH